MIPLISFTSCVLSPSVFLLSDVSSSQYGLYLFVNCVQVFMVPSGWTHPTGHPLTLPLEPTWGWHCCFRVKCVLKANFQTGIWLLSWCVINWFYYKEALVDSKNHHHSHCHLSNHAPSPWTLGLIPACQSLLQNKDIHQCLLFQQPVTVEAPTELLSHASVWGPPCSCSQLKVLKNVCLPHTCMCVCIK